MLSMLTAGLRQLVFLDNCLLCRTFLDTNHERQLCPACLGRIRRNVPPFCPGCSRHLEHFTADGLCASCRGQTRPFDRAWSACLYTEDLRLLLHRFKYEGTTSLRRTFIPLVTEFIDTYHIPVRDFDMVVPIPLHPARLRERGFNQAGVLAEAVAARYALAYRPGALQRIQHTPSQTVLGRKQRWTNLEGAFKIKSFDNCIERSILLVDDLFTTGATAGAAAAALKDAGAAHVAVLTLAMAP